MIGHTLIRYFLLAFGASLLLLPLISNAEESTDSQANALTGEALLAERTRRVVDGYRLAALQLVIANQQPSFVPAWERNPRHLGQRLRLDLSLDSFQEHKQRYLHQGYQLIWQQEYSLGNVKKVAAIWLENDSAKVQYRNRVPFEQAIANYKRTVQGGISVAASRRGKLVFSRGFGEFQGQSVYADTAFPVLAASQAIAGVLAARLEQEKHTAAGVPINLSLNWSVADLLPMMPAALSYSARQVLAHSACIDNQYAASDNNIARQSGSVTYQLASQVWQRPPVSACIPGYLQFYSQPGYLLLGAFLEAATGQTVEQLLLNEITSRFALASIQPATGVSENLLGFGMQANALDLAKLANGILNGAILSPSTSRNRLWKPVSEHSEFGLGWRLKDRRYAEARDDTAASSVRIWVDRRQRTAIVILASHSRREALDDLLRRLQNLI